MSAIKNDLEAKDLLLIAERAATAVRRTPDATHITNLQDKPTAADGLLREQSKTIKRGAEAVVDNGAV